MYLILGFLVIWILNIFRRSVIPSDAFSHIIQDNVNSTIKRFTYRQIIDLLLRIIIDLLNIFLCIALIYEIYFLIYHIDWINYYAIVIITVIIIVISILILIELLKLLFDLLFTKIERVYGPIIKIIKYSRRYGNLYFIIIDDITVEIPCLLFGMIIDDDPYELFFTKYSKCYLAIEPMIREDEKLPITQ
jgi:hypothetical protein